MDTITTALTRCGRAFVPRASALRRTSDRVEVGARWVLAALFLAIVPIALTMGGLSAAQSAEQAQVAATEEHSVSATVVGPPVTDLPPAAESTPPTVHADVAWLGADGLPHRATVPVDETTRTGDVRPLWVDRGDRPADPPPGPAAATVNGVATTLVILAGAALAAAGLLTALRCALDRHRLRAWALAWEHANHPGSDRYL